MKTVYQLMKEHREVIDKNRSPIFGFKVGDVLKPSPKKKHIRDSQPVEVQLWE